MPIKIPKPCSKSWEDMSSTSIGRNCSICQTKVVDFTNWKTEDIIQYIQNADSRVCGRLKSTQQSRNSFFTQIWECKSFVKLSVGLALSAVMWIKPSQANTITQEKNIQIHYTIDTDTTIIQGFVVDSQDRPLEKVNISIDKNDEIFFATDGKGHFTIHLPQEHEKEITLLFRYIGYKSESIKIKLKKGHSHTLKVILEEDLYEIGEVIVKPYSPFRSLLQKLKLKI